MEKKKAIIWGTGAGYKKRENAIKEQYEIVAYTDNSGKNNGFDNYINPTEIEDNEYDIIIICSKPYYLSIKYQLMKKFQIKEEKILGIEGFRDNSSKKSEEIIISHIEEYKKSNKRKEFDIHDDTMWLINEDYFAPASNLGEHYFAQDIWAAKKLVQEHPNIHYDVGSRIDGFLAHLLVMGLEVNYIDIRPFPYNIEGLHFTQGDATTLKNIPDAMIGSLSSLHAVEHFGLGRYGDSIDSEACFKVMKAFQRVLKPGGKLYFGVPIGPKDKLVFNAHRIFHPMTIIKAFDQLELLEFSYVKECETVKIPLEEISNKAAEVPEYSCGLFEFTKAV